MKTFDLVADAQLLKALHLVLDRDKHSIVETLDDFQEETDDNFTESEFSVGKSTRCQFKRITEHASYQILLVTPNRGLAIHCCREAEDPFRNDGVSPLVCLLKTKLEKESITLSYSAAPFKISPRPDHLMRSLCVQLLAARMPLMPI
jgi:hypothetical protein